MVVLDNIKLSRKGPKPNLDLLRENKKKCPGCNQILDISRFFNDKNTWNKLSCYCKQCTVDHNRKYEQSKKKTYFCIKCNSQLHKFGKFCEVCGPIHKKERRKLNERNRRHSSLEYRLKNNISRSIREALSLEGPGKNGRKILDFLPYTISELINHLESQFESWMTWENHGTMKNWNDQDPSTWTWHIDHIIPHSKFKYSSMEDTQFKQCWALENLRPLSARQNISDGNRR